MKTRLAYDRIVRIFALFIGVLSLPAEDRVIVVSSATELNENFDLAAVAEIFKEAEDLQEFERRLNDPSIFLNNLDLNGDGKVDFIRVLEEEKSEGRLIILQAIMGENAYADVAYIDIAKEEDGDYQVQIRGEASLYGDRCYYIPDSYNISRWPIILSIYDPYYEYYYSPFSWNYYPSWWSPCSCSRIGVYRAQITYRYPYRSFRRAYQPCISRYYRPHHVSHSDYTPIRFSGRYSSSHWGYSSRNYYRFNDRRRDSRKDYPVKWKDRDRDERSRFYYIDRSRHRKDRKTNRAGPDRVNPRPPVSIPSYNEPEKKGYTKQPPRSPSLSVLPPSTKKPEKRQWISPPSRSETKKDPEPVRKPEYNRNKKQPVVNIPAPRKTEKKSFTSNPSSSPTMRIAPPKSKKPEPKQRVSTSVRAPRKETTASKPPSIPKMQITPPRSVIQKEREAVRPKPRREK